MGFVLFVLVAFSACGTTPSEAIGPTIITKVVLQTQIVTHVVTVVVTNTTTTTDTVAPASTVQAEIVAAAEATPVPGATKTPLPTSTPTSSIPTKTPLPTTEPATPYPDIVVKTNRHAKIYLYPSEEFELLDLPGGVDVKVLHSGGQWYDICFREYEGWVYKDWISLTKVDATRISQYPGAMPVIAGNVTQVRSGNKVAFKGKVFNVGAITAPEVKISVEIFDGLNFVTSEGFVDGVDVPGGGVRNFSIFTGPEYSSYSITLSYPLEKVQESGVPYNKC